MTWLGGIAPPSPEMAKFLMCGPVYLSSRTDRFISRLNLWSWPAFNIMMLLLYHFYEMSTITCIFQMKNSHSNGQGLQLEVED